MFRPKSKDDQVTQIKKASQVTWLAERCAQTVSEVANLARARLNDYAKQGDTVRVIQLSQRAGSDALNWITLLRSAQIMRSNHQDPTPLFEAILSMQAPQLTWTDGAMIEKLIEDAEVPNELAIRMKTQIPNIPNRDMNL